MNNKFLALVIVLIAVKAGFGQQILPIYNQKKIINNTVYISSDSGDISFKFYSPSLVDVNLSKSAIVETEISPFKKIPVRVTQNIENVYLTTDSLLIIVNKFDLSVEFLTAKEEKLTKLKGYFIANPEQCLRFSQNLDESFQIEKYGSLKTKKLKSGKNKKLDTRKYALKPAKNYRLKLDSPILNLSVGQKEFTLCNNDNHKSFLLQRQ